MVDVETRVRPGKHRVGDLGGEQALLDENGEDRPAKRLGEDGRVVEDQR